MDCSGITSYSQLEKLHPYATAPAGDERVWYRERGANTPLVPAEILTTLFRHYTSQEEPEAQPVNPSRPRPQTPAQSPSTLVASAQPARTPTQTQPSQAQSKENPSASGVQTVPRHTHTGHSQPPNSSPEVVYDWSPSPSSQRRGPSRQEAPPQSSPVPQPAKSPHASPSQRKAEPIRYSPLPTSSDAESLEQAMPEPYHRQASQESGKVEAAVPSSFPPTQRARPEVESTLLSESSEESGEESEMQREPSPRMVVHQTPFTKSTQAKPSSRTKSPSVKAPQVIHQTPFESRKRSVSPSNKESRKRPKLSGEQQQPRVSGPISEGSKIQKKEKPKETKKQQTAKIKAFLEKRLSGEFRGAPDEYHF